MAWKHDKKILIRRYKWDSEGWVPYYTYYYNPKNLNVWEIKNAPPPGTTYEYIKEKKTWGFTEKSNLQKNLTVIASTDMLKFINQ